MSSLLSVFGVAFVLIAALGVLRMPDLYSRMQAASKAAPLGVALLAIAAAVELGSGQVAFRAVLICVFFCLTAPIAAHAIARAGYLSGIKLADEAVIDEMSGAQAPGRPGQSERQSGRVARSSAATSSCIEP